MKSQRTEMIFGAEVVINFGVFLLVLLPQIYGKKMRLRSNKLEPTLL